MNRDTERDDNKPDTIEALGKERYFIFIAVEDNTKARVIHTHTCARTHARTRAHTHSILVESGYTALYYVRGTEL